MRVVRVRNVAEAWAELPDVLRYDAVPQDSRAGRVLVCPEPVATVYSHPRERVLLDPVRDANPFFHLVEALWMLAGRSDAATLNYYVRDFGERFAEPHGEIHGAYGYRWRHAMGVDQLDAIVSKLTSNPLDRQAVLQMWQAEETTCDDLEGSWRDRPCNTHAYFRIRENRSLLAGETYGSVLDMTVCCRSNDMVFGGYGANAVHFSVLQEYLAARIGVQVGTYTQISNNFHVYEDVWERVQYRGSVLFQDHRDPVPLFEKPKDIDRDLQRFFDWHAELWGENPPPTLPSYANPWFATTASRVAAAYYGWRMKRPREVVMLVARTIEAPDWQQACVGWLERRYART